MVVSVKWSGMTQVGRVGVGWMERTQGGSGGAVGGGGSRGTSSMGDESGDPGPSLIVAEIKSM